jgi:hypothetical protein
LDGFIQQICTGRKLVYIENSEEEEIPLLFTHPSPADYRVAGHLYSKAFKEAEDLGLPSVDEMEETIRRRGIYTEEDTAAIEKLRSKLAGQKVVLAKTTKVPARRDRIKDIIAGIEKQIEDIELKREISLEFTKERKAAEEKFLYLSWCGTLDLFTEERFWKTWEDFQKEPDYFFRKKVFLDYIVFVHGISQDIIRYVARSNLWRTRYITAIKTGDPLFGRPIRDYTADQLMVLYWSHYYQSIFEMLPEDRPSDSIVEDDAALDAYMKDWQADRNREAAASKAKKGKSYGDKTAWDHDETLVMKSNPIHEDIEYSEPFAKKEKHKSDTEVDAAPVGRSKKGKAESG